MEYCPVKYPDEFNQDISKNKAVHVYFPQAIPLVAYIDESCLYLKENKCRICEGVCQNNAIDLSQKPERKEINVGAIILSTGLEPYDPRLREEYRYGEFVNVVTSMDYERLLSSTGAYGGEILRASDLKHPHKIAWIQCVGSRQVLPGGNSYCSAVCCTYAQKQVIITKDHDVDCDCVIFHNDVRSYGKDFERYYDRTAALPKMRFIRSYVTIVREDPVTKNVTVRYSTTDEGVKEEEFDMVVLSVGLNPPKDAEGIASKYGIELESHGFCKLDPTNPMITNQPGIFISGAFQGPLDIPESVFSASGAGSQIGELLDYRRGNLAKERIYPEERDVSQEEPRVGVFVCHCGANISRIVSVPSVVEYALTLPNVVYAQEQLLGINQYYYEMANIREHNSWVHAKEKEEATQKAKDIVRMKVARACLLEPLQEFELPVNKNALVIGGGIAGMTCSLSIANQGHDVYLLEKDAQLGGIARKLHSTLEGLDVQAYLSDLIRKVYQHPLIHVYENAEITEASGYVGSFVTKVQSIRGVTEIKHGAVIIAIGADLYTPTEYLYGEDDRVMTNLELEEKIFQEDEKVTGAESLVMIQCVGCRNEDRNYCSRICCSQSIKNALSLKEKNPDTDIYILFRDMRTYGFKEDYYREAANKGVRFVRYEPQDPPEVEPAKEDGKSILRVTVTDYVLGKKLELDADIISLAAAVLPSEATKEMAGLFKVVLSPDGFFKEAHVKLRPVEFGTDGVYLCGITHYPKFIQETINQSYGAAGRVLTLLSRDTVTASGSVCEVDENRCISCGACITACTYGAIEFYESPQGRKARVNPILCKGDGLCNTKCATNAIMLKHFNDQEILSEIDALFTAPLIWLEFPDYNIHLK
ncbi:MAG: Polyferredoxin, heterodixulfide reductase subunit A [Desulfotomaculum sp. 46_296]|nr:MAG: Polyferredoxin, heterodixulfide reductase subunit A [Desulfotomaculum sp. 46_296]